MNKLKKYFDMSAKKKPAPKKEAPPSIPSFTPKKPLPTSKSSFKMPEFSFFSYTRFSIKKQTFFAKRLSFLIKSGVPMLESVHVIKNQSKSKSEISIFNRVVADISNGQSLATSLASFKGVFGSFAINIIKAGEASGNLTSNLSYLADELKKKQILRGKIRSAMLYPLIITLATLGITGLLIIYIFPKIMPIFESLNAELPLSTRILIFLSDAVRNYGFHMLIAIILFSVGLSLLIKNVQKAKYLYHGLILRIPFMGPVIKTYNLTNTTRTLGLLLKSGITLTESLQITGDTTENMQYKKAFTSVSDGVIKGKNISEFLIKYPFIFPDMLSHMVAVGERSGNLSNTLIYLSEYYENEFEDLTKNLSSAIEPVLMIVMGIMVGFVAISIITPIYGITQHLQAK